MIESGSAPSSLLKSRKKTKLDLLVYKTAAGGTEKKIKTKHNVRTKTIKRTDDQTGTT